MEKIKPFYVLDVPVYPYTMDGAVNFLNSQIKNKKQTFVVTANAEIIMLCQRDAEYKKIVGGKADLVLADGAGTVWAGRKLGHNVPERVAGCDLFVELAKLAAKKDYKVFFFGAAPGIAEAARDKLLAMVPGLKVAGCRNGYFKEEETADIVDEINASGADMLFAALGVPKQEKWLAENRHRLNAKVLMGVGGSFDVVAGKMERAPLWMQKASLEWLFRLYKQPSRIGRMMVLPQFVIKVLQSK
ncbi:MAG: glycosyltransferase [Phascolarctobacterium sp.]|nr:MAG: glycosyltransferase [Phascolarctobacterium sp.]